MDINVAAVQLKHHSNNSISLMVKHTLPSTELYGHYSHSTMVTDSPTEKLYKCTKPTGMSLLSVVETDSIYKAICCYLVSVFISWLPPAGGLQGNRAPPLFSPHV